jgi:hypothetical protein
MFVAEDFFTMQTLPCICCKDVLQRCALALCEVTVLACRAFRQRLDQPVLVLHGADDAALGTRLLTGIEAAVPQVTPAGAASFLIVCDTCPAIRSGIFVAVVTSLSASCSAVQCNGLRHIDDGWESN